MACGRCWDFEVAIIGTDAVIRLPVSRPRWVPAVGQFPPLATGGFLTSNLQRSVGERAI